MGNVHTPKTIYKNGMVVEFYVKNKEIFYKLWKWDSLGTGQVCLETAKLGEQKPNDIIEKAQQSFGEVIRQ